MRLGFVCKLFDLNKLVKYSSFKIQYEMNVKKIALFASGSGSNVQNIIKYFADNKNINVDSVWCNNPKAYVLERAANENIDTFIFNREQFYKTGEVVEKLKKRDIDLVVLAGFFMVNAQ